MVVGWWVGVDVRREVACEIFSITHVFRYPSLRYPASLCAGGSP